MKRMRLVIVFMLILMLVAPAASGDVRYAVKDLGTDTAYGVNNRGQVVGGNDFGRAYLWDSLTGMRDLGTIGGNTSVAYSVNDLGQVVGQSATANGGSHAFMWENGIMTDLGLPFPQYDRGSQARDVNDKGQVIGGGGDALS